MKIGIVGNCQSREITRALKRRYQDLDIQGYFMGSQSDTEKLEADISKLDHCVTININKAWGFLATENLSRLSKNIILAPQMTFTGLHPDLTYIKHENKNTKSPVGSYHSKIIAASFTIGLSESRTKKLFNKYIFNRLGYLDEYEKSLIALEAELNQANFELEVDQLTSIPFMHTFNHPNSTTISLLAREIARKIGLNTDGWETESDVRHDSLAKDTIWPVYPEIAEHIGWGKDKGSYAFKPEIALARTKDDILTLEEMIALSFERYRSIEFDRSAIRETEAILKHELA